MKAYKKDFGQLPNVNHPRSSFDMEAGLKTTFDSGYLIPIFLEEALPGDTFKVNMNALGRLSTPIHPFMDNLYFETQFFAVPTRLLWSNWKRFNGEQRDPGDSTDYTIPQITAPAGGWGESTLMDYLGVPPGVDNLSVSALFPRAYNRIYNDWYRDENLQDSIHDSIGDGPDAGTQYVLRRRGKRHDYFTSCLPWPQKGDAVELPLGTSAPIVTVTGTGNNVTGVKSSTDGAMAGTDTGLQVTSSAIKGSPSGDAIYFDPNGTLEADLSTATAATINSLREAEHMQELFERDARGGTRYIEILKSHFGVDSPDGRQQRAEYLGGGSSRINVNPVAQTSSTDATTPQGNLAAMGVLDAENHGFTKSFTEHCVVMGIASVRADLTYQQGIDRMWSRTTRYDYYWPSLANLGEQAVLNKEIYADGSANDELVFGYQERYGEYRYKQSKITGAFRSSAAASLDAWHLGQDFGSLPTLNTTFIMETPPVDRVVAVTSEPELILDAWFNFTAVRPMPTYGVPGLMARF